MDYSDNAKEIYKNLYRTPNESNHEQVHVRVSEALGLNDDQKVKFLIAMNDKAFRPGTPCLINAGRKGTNVNSFDKNLSPCFIQGMEDTMNSIAEMWECAAKIYAGAGGMGVPITNLREKDALISSGGRSSGPIRYLRTLQSIAESVRSGGRARRAANLISMKYNHPDIMDLIVCKQVENFSAMNMSVLVDDYFMDLVINNRDTYIDLISPNKGTVIKKIKVREIWEAIVNNAHTNGDPGLLFYNRLNQSNPFPSFGDIIATNPCGEVGLPEWHCCNLGAINLNNVLIDNNQIDWNKFKEYIRLGVEFLNNVIDNTTYPHRAYKKTMFSTRPIGLGIMGFADILLRMNIKYGSDESSKLFGQICKFLTKEAFAHSIYLAGTDEYKDKKLEIPATDINHFEDLLYNYIDYDQNLIELYRKNGIINNQVSTLQPTGSVSISADCSYSWEPLMAIIWEKPLSDRDTTLKFINQEFINAMKTRGIDVDDELIQKIIINKGSIQNVSGIPDDIKNIFVCAHDISWDDKVKMQSVGQPYITLGISSTCNLPNSATIEDVENTFIYAYKAGLKGITIYRDGSRSEQPVNFGKVKKVDATTLQENLNLPPVKMKRPKIRKSLTYETETAHGTLYLTVGMDTKGKIFEIFINLGKSGHFENLTLSMISRCISTACQHGIPIDVFQDLMRGTKGQSFFFPLDTGQSVFAESIFDAIDKIIDYIKSTISGNTYDTSLEICPNCGKRGVSHKISSCRSGTCVFCNWSQCQ